MHLFKERIPLYYELKVVKCKNTDYFKLIIELFASIKIKKC